MHLGSGPFEHSSAASGEQRISAEQKVSFGTVVSYVVKGMTRNGQYGERGTSKGKGCAVLQRVGNALKGAAGGAIDGATVPVCQLERAPVWSK